MIAPIETLVPACCRLGEAPTWHASSGCLFWVDIANPALHRYHIQTGTHQVVHTGRCIAGITVQADESLLLFGVMGAIDCWMANRLWPVRRPRPKHFGYRFNDVVADPSGRVFAGMIGFDWTRRWPKGDRLYKRVTQLLGQRPEARRPGTFWRLDQDMRLLRLPHNFGQPNGMAWSPDESKLYASDSSNRSIRQFCIHPQSGELDDGEVLIDATGEAGRPDGLVVDADGGLWSAQHGGGCIIRYDATGRIIDRYCMPSMFPTSLAFGGAENAELFITSSALSGVNGGPADGALFRMSTGVQGATVWPSQISIPGLSQRL